MNNNSRNLTRKLIALSLYQIIGGIMGLGLTVWLISTAGINAMIILLTILPALAFYFYSLYCGILLLRKPIDGLKHSKINQILQVFNFSIFGYAFQYVSGILISVGIDLTNFNLKFNLGLSTWRLNINSDDNFNTVSVNLVALYLIIFIVKKAREIKAFELSDQITTTGQNI